MGPLLPCLTKWDTNLLPDFAAGEARTAGQGTPWESTATLRSVNSTNCVAIRAAGGGVCFPPALQANGAGGIIWSAHSCALLSLPCPPWNR